MGELALYRYDLVVTEKFSGSESRAIHNDRLFELRYISKVIKFSDNNCAAGYTHVAHKSV